MLVAKGDDVYYKKAFGMADLALQIPVLPRHKFRIGSITKQFTAVAIMLMVQRGKIELEDPISEYLPQFRNGQNITIKQLLNHTSGIANYTELPKWDEAARRRDFTPAALTSYFEHEEVLFEPGTSWKYNDSGYVLLGHIVEVVTQKSYAEFLEEEVLRPMQLDIQYETQSLIISNKLNGYRETEGRVLNAEFVSMTQAYAAGGLVANPQEIWSWTRGIFQGNLIDVDLLAQAFSETIVKGDQFPYGFGWQIDYPGGQKALYHHGWINGYFTTAWYLPESEVFVAVFSNCTCYNPIPVAKDLIALWQK